MWLLICTAAVAIGVILEESETIARWRWLLRVAPVWILVKQRLKRWVNGLSRIGWVLIVIGVVGEGVCEGLVSTADRWLQEFSNISLVAAQRQADRANERASVNEKEAAMARATAESAKASVKGYDKQIADDQARIKTAEATVALAKASVRDAVAKLATADARIAEAQRGAAEANRAAESERLERQRLEVLVAPRRLTRDQQKKIADRLKGFSGHSVTVSTYSNDGESIAIATEIIAALKTGGITVTDERGNSLSSGSWFTGMNIRGPASENSFIIALRAALYIEGNIDAGINQPTPMPTMTGNAALTGRAEMTGSGALRKSGSSPPGSPVVIEVGMKPYEIETLK
jgi:hypothetical protein